MLRILLAFCLSFLALSCVAADVPYDFKGVPVGSSIALVRQKLGTQLPLSKLTPSDQVPKEVAGIYCDLSKQPSFTVGAVHPTGGEFTFVKSQADWKLAAVTFEFENDESVFNRLVAAMKQKFGKPTEEQSDSLKGIAFWDNQVSQAGVVRRALKYTALSITHKQLDGKRKQLETQAASHDL